MGAESSDDEQNDVDQRYEQGDAQDARSLLSPTVAGVHVHCYKFTGSGKPVQGAF